MIESRFWKNDLLGHSKKLKKMPLIKRWSEKAQVNFEKEVIISFFMIRKLIEENKISKNVIKSKFQLFAYPRKEAPITGVNHLDISEVYDLEKQKKVTKDITFISNQLIHSLTLFAIRKNKKWDHILITSDYEKSNYLYELSIDQMVNIFELIGNDYPQKISYDFDSKFKDYKVEVGE